MLLDSLEVITGEKKTRASNLKECKGKSLATVYEKLFCEPFNPRGRGCTWKGPTQ